MQLRWFDEPFAWWNQAIANYLVTIASDPPQAQSEAQHTFRRPPRRSMAREAFSFFEAYPRGA